MRHRMSGTGGSVLLETLLVMLIMTLVGLSLITLIQKGTIASFKAREQATCTRMVQTGFSRLKNISYYSLFEADSALADYGLWAAYPSSAVLAGIQSTLSSSKFDRFRIRITVMRRDASDANADGLTSDLIAFTDNNGDNIDDYDSNIRYNDQNIDGDYFDTYTSGGRIVSEQPDTHIKKVTFDVFRQGRQVCSMTELVSLEQFSGDVNPSSEAVLILMLSTPTNNAYLYRSLTAGQISSRGLPMNKSYPSDVTQNRADAGSSLLVSGETDPLATVNLYVGSSGILETAAADMSGAFSQSAVITTANLVEGNNLLSVQAVKGVYTSPITQRSLLLDFNAPSASNTLPSGVVATLAPYVAVNLFDEGLSTTVVSGVCPDVITMKINGAEVFHSFDSGTGVAVWIDSTTNTVPVLSSGAYTAYVEAGDYAGYKTTQTWTFTLAVSGTDHSAPSVANKSPSGMAASQLPVISAKVFDNQSGINPLSIRMTLDGVVVVDSSTIAGAYTAQNETVSYTPPAAFDPGSSHAVELRVSHFAADPADKVESVDAWSFNVP